MLLRSLIASYVHHAEVCLLYNACMQAAGNSEQALIAQKEKKKKKKKKTTRDLLADVLASIQSTTLTNLVVAQLLL